VLKKYQDAEKDFETSLRLNPETGTPFFNLAQVYELTGRKAEAIESYRKAEEYLSSFSNEKVKEKIKLRLQGKWDSYKEWL
jgi:tetratricopeptide (TPR) repeat protein